MSQLKEKLIQEHLEKPYEVGEYVLVRGYGTKNKKSFISGTNILSFSEDGKGVYINEYKSKVFYSFDDIKKNVSFIGIDPFEAIKERPPKNINFTLEGIYYLLFKETQNDRYKTEKGFPIGSLNWNPFIEMNGKKEYYQRDFVWDLEDKQLLIDSIYNNITCGAVIVRKRSFDFIEKQTNPNDCQFNDIVDGKQRMRTIYEFVNSMFPDSLGRYYSDFSKVAQRKFFDNQVFSYFEFDESATDYDVIQQFLKVNFTGKPQSKEHIEYVKSLLK